MSLIEKAFEDEANTTNLNLESITDGLNERRIPIVKFIADVGAFAETFSPPASAELLIGAYSGLLSKFQDHEKALAHKRKSIIKIMCSD
jgi:hypothetical protein